MGMGMMDVDVESSMCVCDMLLSGVQRPRPVLILGGERNMQANCPEDDNALHLFWY